MEVQDLFSRSAKGGLTEGTVYVDNLKLDFELMNKPRQIYQVCDSGSFIGYVRVGYFCIYFGKSRNWRLLCMEVVPFVPDKNFYLGITVLPIGPGWPFMPSR
ncbi:MAG: hypothetical protein IPJ86_00110 [Bacteroidetes bacterium]|nr:hypothetical protein [Bacteroidota bacterium]